MPRKPPNNGKTKCKPAPRKKPVARRRACPGSNCCKIAARPVACRNKCYGGRCYSSSSYSSSYTSSSEDSSYDSDSYSSDGPCCSKSGKCCR